MHIDVTILQNVGDTESSLVGDERADMNVNGIQYAPLQYPSIGSPQEQMHFI
jgi:hypothetical protein